MNENLYSLDLEKSVLSILMMICGVDEYIDAISENDFFATRHQIIFNHVKKLQSQGKAHDVEMVLDSIKKDKVDLNTVNGDYIVDLYTQSNGNSRMIAEYVKTLREYTSRRSLFTAGERIKIIASDVTQYSAIDALSQSESVLGSLESNEDSRTLHDAYNLSIDLFNDINNRVNARAKGVEKINGIKTGFMDLDLKLGVIAKTDLVIIAARPSMGKTAFAQCLMLNASFLQQHPVLFQSAEMSKDKIATRLVSGIAGINLRDMRDATIPDDKWGDFVKATEKLKSSKILIDDMPRPSISDIRRNCRKMRVKHGYVGAVFVDYLTLMKSPIDTDNNHLAVGAISKGLKNIAKEFDCPVFCLSQLNRGVEKRTDKRPMMSDIRESGSIEEDADIIMFLYRDDYYNKDSKDMNVAEVIIAKARDGEVGTVRLGTELQYSRFADLMTMNEDY